MEYNQEKMPEWPSRLCLNFELYQQVTECKQACYIVILAVEILASSSCYLMHQ